MMALASSVSVKLANSQEPVCHVVTLHQSFDVFLGVWRLDFRW